MRNKMNFLDRLIRLIRLKLPAVGNMQMGITKPVLVIKSGKKLMADFPNLEKKFYIFFIVVFSFSAALGMIVLICIFHHLQHCHFDP